MSEFLSSHGLLGLFLASFLASTLIPFGSEWLLILLVSQEINIFQAVAVATCGNFLGACTTYWVGFVGYSYLRKNIFKIKQESVNRAQHVYDRYGSWSLLFSWLPLVGDPLCFVSGSLKLHFGKFSTLVLTGKLARYLAVSFLAKELV